MKKQLKIGVLAFILSVFSVHAQQENPKKLKKESDRYIYEAQEALSENDYASAEAEYRKAIAKDPSNTVAKYNMGNLYYGKENTVSAENRLKQAAKIAESKSEKHQIYHNLGNSYMQKKDYSSAVEAYKNALRNDPSDDETRYNLALAKQKEEEEQKNGQGQDQNKDQNKDQQNDGGGGDQDQQDQDQNKDQNEGEGGDQNKDQQPKDEGDNNKDKKEGDQNKDQQNEQGEQPKDQQGDGDKKQQQQPKAAQGQLSPQQIKSLLEAMNNEEKKVQDKINAEKAKGVKVRTEKDW